MRETDVVARRLAKNKNSDASGFILGEYEDDVVNGRVPRPEESELEHLARTDRTGGIAYSLLALGFAGATLGTDASKRLTDMLRNGDVPFPGLSEKLANAAPEAFAARLGKDRADAFDLASTALLRVSSFGYASEFRPEFLHAMVKTVAEHHDAARAADALTSAYRRSVSSFVSFSENPFFDTKFLSAALANVRFLVRQAYPLLECSVGGANGEPPALHAVLDSPETAARTGISVFEAVLTATGEMNERESVRFLDELRTVPFRPCYDFNDEGTKRVELLFGILMKMFERDGEKAAGNRMSGILCARMAECGCASGVSAAWGEFVGKCIPFLSPSGTAAFLRATVFVAGLLEVDALFVSGPGGALFSSDMFNTTERADCIAAAVVARFDSMVSEGGRWGRGLAMIRSRRSGTKHGVRTGASRFS